MSYGNTNTNLQCDCCGYFSKDSTPPGIYYMDMFFRHKCRSCEDDTYLCSSCTGKSIESKSEHIDGEWRVDCKSCTRDRKIDKIVDGKN